MKKFIYSLLIILAVVCASAQSTTTSYTRTLKFFSSDLLQMYEGARIAAPTMTLPNSLTTYTSTLPFGNSDNRQLYNAIRGMGDAVSGFTNTSWNLTGNSVSTNTNFIGTTSNRSLLFYTNNTQKLKIDSLGSVFFNTNSSNTNYNAVFSNGIIEGAALTYSVNPYAGFWLGTKNRYPLLLVADIDGGRVPSLSVSSQTSGAIGGIKINPVTYTNTASLEVNQGGGANILELNSASESTLVTVEATTGNMRLAGNIAVGNTNTVVTGNSGTLSVLTDNYFTISSSFNIQALTASTTYYWSSNTGLGVRSTVNQSAVSIPYNCTLIGASISAWNAGSTTSQTNSTLFFRVNNTTDNTVSSSVLWNTSGCANCATNSNVTNLSVSLNAGDTWENKLTLGALATPPNNGNVTVTYYFSRR